MIVGHDNSERAEYLLTVREKCRLGVITSHFIQYLSPLWRELATRPEIDLTVYYLSDAGRRPVFDRQFGEIFSWDVPLDEGYRWQLLSVASDAPLSRIRTAINVASVRLLWRDAADVVLRSDYDSLGALLFLYNAWIHRTPVLYRGDTTPISAGRLPRWVRRTILGPVFRHAIYALAVGRLARQHAVDLGVPECRIFSSPHAVDGERWQVAAIRCGGMREECRRKLGVPIDTNVVLYCGKLIPCKRVGDLLRAAGRLSAMMPLTVLLAGAGEQRNVLEVLAGQYPSLNTRFLGFQRQQDLPTVYAASDVICLPSSSETWGLVINEAMFFNCIPIVSDRVGCGPDLVEGIGETYPVGDDVALAGCLERVLRERAVRARKVPSRLDQYSLERAADGIVSAALAAMRRGGNRGI